MSEVRTYRDLVVWQKGMDIVTKIYDLTRDFPASEIYGLTSQIRRCAVSVPSNMAEGYGRRSTQEYIRFLQIASGSLFELQTQLQISINLNYISNRNYSGILIIRPLGCFIDNNLRNCRRGFTPRFSKWPHRNRGINPLLQFSQAPTHENFLVSPYYPAAFILEAKPNFIPMLSDGPGYGDLSCYLESKIREDGQSYYRNRPHAFRIN